MFTALVSFFAGDDVRAICLALSEAPTCLIGFSANMVLVACTFSGQFCQSLADMDMQQDWEDIMECPVHGGITLFYLSNAMENEAHIHMALVVPDFFWLITQESMTPQDPWC